jgi:hypothetical protein
MILQIIMWLFILYGIVQIIVDSKLFSWLKWLLDMSYILRPLSIFLNCFLCVSVWTAFLMSYYLWSPTEHLFTFKYQFFIDGMFGSACVWFIRLFEIKISK